MNKPPVRQSHLTSPKRRQRENLTPRTEVGADLGRAPLLYTRDVPAGAGLRPAIARQVLELQATRGNEYVQRAYGSAGAPARDGLSHTVERDYAAVHAAFVQRAPPDARAVPPRRPKIRKKAKAPAAPGKASGPMDWAGIFTAIVQLEYDSIQPEDLALLSKLDLVGIDAVTKYTVEKCEKLADEQEANPAFVPPAGMPDVWYRGAAEGLSEFRREKILTRNPRDVLAAVEKYNLMEAKSIGSTPEAKQLWKISTEKMREIFWLMMISPPGSATGVFSDSEVLKYGYVDETAWRSISKSRFVKGKIPESSIVEAIRESGTIVPAELAEFLVRSTETLGLPKALSKLSDKLDDIDKVIAVELTHIQEQQVSALPYKSIVTHENTFWKWLWSTGAGKGTVYGAYRSWADPESNPIFKPGFDNPDLYAK